MHRILVEDPGHIAARLDMGRLLVDDAERLASRAVFAEAEAWLRATLKRRPAHPIALALLGRLALTRGDADLAALHLLEAVRTVAASGEDLPAEILVVLGRIALARGDENDALRAFFAAVKADPTLGEAHARAGLLLIAMRDYEAGLRALDRAVRRDRRLVRHPELARARAAAHLGLHDLAKARAAAREAAAVDPDHPRTRLLRAELRLRVDPNDHVGGAAMLASRADLRWILDHTEGAPELSKVRARASARLGEIEAMLRDDPSLARTIAAAQAAQLEKRQRAQAKAERARLLDLERKARSAHEAWALDLPRPTPP